MSYVPPLRDLRFVLHELFNVCGRLQAVSGHEDLDAETLDQVADAAGKFAAEVVQPLNAVADRHGCTYHENGTVSAPPGFRAAYEAWCKQGWPGAAVARVMGGQGLPNIVFCLLHEQVSGASQAFGMFAAINHMAIQCLRLDASSPLMKRWLPELVEGRALATMCLSEPQAGSDLGLLRTRAEEAGDGSWFITGNKIFASGAEHNLTENILHLVLARLPDAPAGTKGLSLFLVPKQLDDGSLNAVHCDGIEHKMGLHGSPTCAMRFSGATGWMIGAPHQGLRAMFPMLNTARLFTGVQALGIGEAAHQQTLGYARERRQGQAVGRAKEEGGHPLIRHPDVQRMLMRQRAWNEGARALVLWTAFHIDVADGHADEAQRQRSLLMLDLLTPIAKGFLSENAQEVAALAVQVHGGHGFVRDTGVEQLSRDVRITTIYEGTTGIQAIDLLVRKLLPDDGRYIGLLRQVMDHAIGDCRAAESSGSLSGFAASLTEIRDRIVAATERIRSESRLDPELPYRVACDYLRLFGHALMGAQWGRMAAVSTLALRNGDDPFYRSKLTTARFYFDQVMPETERLYKVLQSAELGLSHALEA